MRPPPLRFGGGKKIDERGLKTGRAERHPLAGARKIEQIVEGQRRRANELSRAGQFRSDDPEIACHEGMGPAVDGLANRREEDLPRVR